ncbi:MAG: iron ABC transporter permease [Methylobacteriaceae bacterium]|nr:iron ABC transporter permease [Methylobacteriaceae bacterium]
MNRSAAAPSGVAAAYRARAARRLAGLGFAALGLAVAALLDMATGPAFLSPSAVARSVLRLAEDRTIDAIVWSIRLPIAAIAILVGATLGLTGAIMQTILANPLASSYTLGVSAGAGFGAALVIVMGAALPLPELYAVPIAAFVFAGLACAGVYGVGALRGATPEMLALAGIAMLFLFQALLSLLQFMASPEALQQIVFWLFGSLQRATWTKAGLILATLAVAAPFLARDCWRLTALKLGDERAASLGVDPRRLRLRALALVALLTGVAVAFVGAIGFVGLVAPHVARMFLGEDQRYLLVGSALVGALTLSLASVASKSISPGALFPIGIVTAMIGVPFFIWLILRSRRSFW